MNWSITTTDPSAIYDEDYTLDYSDADDNTARPNEELVQQARDAAANLGLTLGEPVLITISGHENTAPGDGFRSGYVSITVSKTDPDNPPHVPEFQEAEEAETEEAPEQEEAV
jgi:hypothetical protein